MSNAGAQSASGTLPWRIEDLERRDGRGIVFPSIGEYPVYDEWAYEAMMADTARVMAFKTGLEAAVQPGATVVELGCGGLAPWARYARDLGAERVFAVERLPEARAAARATVAADNSDGCAIEVVSPEEYAERVGRVDVLVAEVVGTIGSSEGAGVTIGAEVRRISNPDLVVLPSGWVSEVRGFSFIRSANGYTPAFPSSAEPYLRRLAETAGEFRDVRLCGVGPRLSAGVLTAPSVFEVAQFGGVTSEVRIQPADLEVVVDGTLDSLLLSVRVLVGKTWIDSFTEQTSWLPVVVPFESKIDVTSGNVLTVDSKSTIGTHLECPDYSFNWSVRGEGEFGSGQCDFPWQPRTIGGTPLHRSLLL